MCSGTIEYEIWFLVSTPLKNMKVSWDYYSQYGEKKAEILIIWPIHVHAWLKSTSPHYKLDPSWLHQKNAGSNQLHIRRTNRDIFWLADGRLKKSSRGCRPTCDLIWSDQGSDLWGLPWEECEFFIVSGWWLSPTPLKNMSSSVRDIIPSIWKNKKCSKPPTRFGSIHAQLLSIYQSCQEIGIGERTLMCKEVICKSSGRRFWGLGSCSGSKFQNQDPKHRSFQTTQFPETLHAKSKTVERSDGKRMCFFFLNTSNRSDSPWNFSSRHVQQ